MLDSSTSTLVWMPEHHIHPDTTTNSQFPALQACKHLIVALLPHQWRAAWWRALRLRNHLSPYSMFRFAITLEAITAFHSMVAAGTQGRLMWCERGKVTLHLGRDRARMWAAAWSLSHILRRPGVHHRNYTKRTRGWLQCHLGDL